MSLIQTLPTTSTTTRMENSNGDEHQITQLGIINTSNNGNNSNLDPITINYSRTRPILKRSRTPYTPSGGINTKRIRRTSPTKQFSQLSISNSDQTNSSSTSSSTSGSRRRTATEDDHNTVRMRSTYSAYEIGPDRIFIESLSDDQLSTTSSLSSSSLSSSPTTSSCTPTTLLPTDPARESLNQDQERLLDISPLLAQNIIRRPFSIPSTIPDYGSYESNPNNQLVIYRKPIWSSEPCSSSDFQHETIDRNSLQIDDLDHHRIIEVDHDLDLQLEEEPDSMDLD